MDYVLDFCSLDKNSLAIAGGKNANLGEMLKAGIRVPPGFAVTTHSFLEFISQGKLRDRIFHAMGEVDPNKVETIEAKSQEIKALIVEAPIPEKIRQAMEAGYEDLCKECGTSNVPVAVRSSATAEDLPTASFAGQQDTYLWVQGTQEVITSIKSCWASLFGPRAIAYRIKHGFGHQKVHISVGVQKMVNAKAAGVMFTLDPTNGDPSKIVIEGSWGLGETVVSGSVNPDKFVIDKVMMELNDKRISRKHVQFTFSPEVGKAVELEVPEEMQEVCCLEDKEIIELVILAKRIESHYKTSMDIEWSIDKDIPFPENVFIVQARPETVWSQKRKESKVGMKSSYELLMEQAMKRIKIQ